MVNLVMGINKFVQLMFFKIQNNENIIEAFKGKVEIIVQASNMQEAVNQSYALAGKQDVVLLSPACASFDLFANYEDRGIQFKKQVRNL